MAVVKMKFRSSAAQFMIFNFPRSALLVCVCALSSAYAAEPVAKIYPRALEEVHLLAIEGDRAAIVELCDRYRYGLNAAVNDAAAIAWCMAASRQKASAGHVLLVEADPRAARSARGNIAALGVADTVRLKIQVEAIRQEP